MEGIFRPAAFLLVICKTCTRSFCKNLSGLDNCFPLASGRIELNQALNRDRFVAGHIFYLDVNKETGSGSPNADRTASESL